MGKGVTDSQWPAIPGYRIEKELGRRRMATVYLAVQESLQRPVALKVMKAALAADEEFAERFVREARTAASLQHSSIVAIHDAGQAGHHSYIAMEYVAGGELKDRLRAGAMEEVAAVTVIRQIAAGLNYAHGKGFVHRDVKPENILFREDGTAVLSDFGIARAIGSATRMTGTGMSIGTPHYMSPEQARGRNVDGRSDLYALGVVFQELLTGRVPFYAQDSFAVGLMHINESPPELPVHLSQYQPILDHLLAKDPDDRYQNGAELIEGLDHIEKGNSPKAARSATRVIKSTDRRSGITDHGKGREQNSRAGLYWGLGGAALATVLGVGVYFWQNQATSPTAIGGGTSPDVQAVPATPESTTPEPRTLNPEPAPSSLPASPEPSPPPQQCHPHK